MPTPAVVRQSERGVAWPLKTLVPLIKRDLASGDRAGLEYFKAAGDKLREARIQVATHRWASWLTKNFSLSRTTAWRYMRLSELAESGDGFTPWNEESLRESTERARSRDTQRRAVTRPLRDAVADVDVEHLTQARESRETETQLHRDLALELIDIGYKALATRLHPDRGGSKDAMRRLNRVREELKSVAETRRFE